MYRRDFLDGAVGTLVFLVPKNQKTVADPVLSPVSIVDDGWG